MQRGKKLLTATLLKLQQPLLFYLYLKALLSGIYTDIA